MFGARRSDVCLLAVVWFFVGGRVEALPRGWLMPRALTTTPAGHADEPDLAAEGLRLRVVWTDTRLGFRALFTRLSEDGGISWGEEEVVSLLPGEAAHPSVVTDGAQDFLVWTQRDGGRTDIVFSSFREGIWKPPKPITVDGVSSRPKLALTRAFPRTLGLVFERQTPDGTRVFWTRSADGGATWEPPSLVTSGGHLSDQPTIAAGAETFYLAWRDAREGDTGIFFNRATDRLGKEERLLSLVPQSRSPSLAVFGERVLAAWQSPMGFGGPQVFVALSEDGGREWSTPLAVSTSLAQSTRPAVVLGEGVSWVVWQDGAFGNWELHLSRGEGEGIWSAEERFTESPEASLLPRLAFSFRTHLVWVERDGDKGALVFYAAHDSISPPSPKMPTHFDLSANPGWDDDGSLLFRWEPVSDAVRYRVVVFSGEKVSEQTTTQPEIAVEAPDGGAVRVQVVAEDAVGNVSEPSPLSEEVFVDRSPPEVRLLEPKAGSLLFEKTPVRLACQDAHLRFCLVEYGATPAPSAWTPLTSPFTDSFEARVVAEWEVASLRGLYTLRVSAEDRAGNRTVVTATVFFDVSPPWRLGAGELEYPLAPSDLATSRREPAWSPDGKQLVFVSDEGGTQDLWLVEASGKNLRPLTRDLFPDASPAWSPDGKFLVYSSFREGVWGLYLLDLVGGREMPVLAGGENRTAPAWSPDGERLAFVTDRDGDDEIVLLENWKGFLKGAAPRLTQVTRNRVADTRPTWSRDGRFLAFQTAVGGGWDIARVRLEDLAFDRLVDDPREETAPRFSPDGKRLLFTRQGTSLVALDLVTHEETVLSPSGTPVRNGDWSPEGSLLVVEAGREIAVLRLAFPASSLEGRIVSPAEGAFLEGSVDIFGVARGSQFVDYRIEAAPWIENAAWFPVTGVSTSPVEREGFLGRWEVGSFRGVYRLRLTVRGSDGTLVRDEVRVEIRAARPQLEVREPPDGLETLLAEVRLLGRTEPNVLVTLNGERFSADEEGNFSATVPLRGGVNLFEVKATDALGATTTITRRVTRVVDTFSVTLEAPTPFTFVEVPYVEVRGVAPRAERVQVNGIEVPIGDDGRFSRVLRLASETTRIEVVATDVFGRVARAQTRVFLRQNVSRDRPDGLPPALVEPFPPDGARLSEARRTFLATVVDDRAFDPDSLKLTLDGISLEPETWRFDPPTGTLRFEPLTDLAEGPHRLVVEGNDKAGNALLFGEWRVVVDTVPLEVQVSAVLVSLAEPSRLRVVLTSNRRLVALENVQVRLPGQTTGYPLELRLVGEPTDEPPSRPFVYAAEFSLPYGSQAYLSAEVRDRFGRRARVVGDFASGLLSPHQPITLQLSGEVTLHFGKEVSARPRRMVFRTQDGRDFAHVQVQRSDIRARKLLLETVGAGVYVVEDAEGGEDVPSFFLSVPEDPATRRAWFAWDEASQRWVPLLDQHVRDGRRIAQSTGAREYALLGDVQAPVFVVADPPSRSEIPPDRYFVDVEFRDEGSGVAEATAFLDDVPVPVRWTGGSSERTWVRYVPTDLEPGLHTLRVRVRDRAGNVAEVLLEYTTTSLFAFTGLALVPNPVRERGKVFFQLTETADVTLDIFAPDGTRVYSATMRQVSGGLEAETREAFVWDLANASGRKVAGGIYVVRLSARNDAGVEIRRFAKWAVVR